MNLLDQLTAARGAMRVQKPKQSNTGAETRARNHRNRYAKVFGDKQLTTAQVAQGAGISPIGCLNVLNDFERLGLVRKVGRRPTGGTNPTIVWEWIGETE